MADMNETADINRRLESLIRYGTVADVQAKPPRVRIQVGQLKTTWVRWVALRAATTSDWCPPVPGEQCVLLSPSGDMASAVALLGLASDEYPLPSDNPDEWVRRFPDGAVVRYHHANSALTVSGIKTATVQAAEHVTVDCPESTFTGNVTIKGTLTVEKLFSYLAGMSGQGGSDGGETSITGNIRHTEGTLSSNGVVLHTHTHSGVERGNDNTGGPQ
jgi:phage baseplate assembly protein V